MIEMAQRKETQEKTSFGKRLAQLRKQAGFSQFDLSKQIGISRRMVAYYEVQTDRPPAHLLLPIAKTLAISVDELLGISKTKKAAINRKLLNQLEKIKELPRNKQKAIFDHIDALARFEKEKK